MEFQRTNFNVAQPYETLRIEVGGKQNEDTVATCLCVHMDCLDADGNVVHSLVKTGYGYTTFALSHAICRSARTCVHIIDHEKLTFKPKRIEFIVHDYISFLFLTKQIQPTYREMQIWTSGFFRYCKNCGSQVTVTLGDPAKANLFKTERMSKGEDLQGLIPSLEMLGEVQKAFVKQQAKFRGLDGS